jgi:uncharacterized cupredoxin-like copper-binding protein
MNKLTLITALLLALAAPMTHAHGTEEHTGPVTKEQKPWGIAADAKAAKRTITFTMSDAMRFTPDRIEVRQGETVKLAIRNEGKLLHEFVLGTRQALDEHAALMVKFPTMEHSEPYMAHVPPGKTGEIVWTFNRAGDFDFACLIAGHYQAGMVGKVRVVQAGSADDMTTGEVRKVDKDSKKITIRHGEIRNLGMPPMTMVFQVKDPAWLDQFKAGDTVRFTVEKTPTGVYLVTDIQPGQ